jgi:hypothetical protein
MGAGGAGRRRSDACAPEAKFVPDSYGSARLMAASKHGGNAGICIADVGQRNGVSQKQSLDSR